MSWLPKSHLRFAWSVAVVFALWVGVSASARAEIKVGDLFPSLANAGLVNLAGGDLPVTAGQVVLVDFWASWCAPCKASFPAMARLHQEFGGKGLVVTAVSVDEKPAAAAAFWKRLAPPFATLHDRELKLVKAVVVPTMPTSYLLAWDGRVRYVHRGFRGDSSERELRQQIQTLLAEKTASVR